ncbi:polyphosphate:AMP phosphotransferase [Thioalkalivibrio denitrificans]|uniref:Polyphosphate:AMP phosphotransferase n=1 Tax=Thioalkalivibrio denitrificans TaxID=108003 RepID=A0A1V3NEV7_9GAMM|nr:polyphosphate:AMP phosphotransferase [Thioalkalivibrio denitrificans]OOG23418.1 polyphosphate:AMP phosphotransferase [Thioalkalivibrio denitrificans]
MFEAAELGRKVSKSEYRDTLPDLRTCLVNAQWRLRDSGVSVLVIVEGVEGVGRGEVVNRLNGWLDTRGTETHAFWDVSSEEQTHPRYWRYWRSLPSRGKIGLFFGGWYAEPLVRGATGEWEDARVEASATRIRDLEHMLALDDTLILKFWFHLDRDTQKQRLKARREDPDSRWSRRRNGDKLLDYKALLGVGETLIRATDTAVAPWYLIEAADARYRDLTVARTLLETISARLDATGPAERKEALSHAPSLPEAEAARRTVLDQVDLGQSLAKPRYRKRLEEAQRCLRSLTWKAFDAGRASVLVFEGWDAAGKGGTIRRLTAGIDARLHRVIPVGAPTDEELAHHYLWRFWRRVPGAGRITVFDRSWYGRVLVERVEGLAQPAQWRRAYHEINDFEQQLCEHGILVHKFWLHISGDEQLARFRAREKTAYKQHKITDEDWRNREKRPEYEAAVNEMVFRTSTEHAPWTLVPSEDKRFGRVAVLETICERLEAALD